MTSQIDGKSMPSRTVEPLRQRKLDCAARDVTDVALEVGVTADDLEAVAAAHDPHRQHAGGVDHSPGGRRSGGSPRPCRPGLGLFPLSNGAEARGPRTAPWRGRRSRAAASLTRASLVRRPKGAISRIRSSLHGERPRPGAGAAAQSPPPAASCHRSGRRGNRRWPRSSC